MHSHPRQMAVCSIMLCASNLVVCRDVHHISSALEAWSSIESPSASAHFPPGSARGGSLPRARTRFAEEGGEGGPAHEGGAPPAAGGGLAAMMRQVAQSPAMQQMAQQLRSSSAQPGGGGTGGSGEEGWAAPSTASPLPQCFGGGAWQRQLACMRCGQRVEIAEIVHEVAMVRAPLDAHPGFRRVWAEFSPTPRTPSLTRHRKPACTP